MNKDFIHPETQKDEVFLVNSTKKNFNSMKWASKRLGVTALDGQGHRIDVANWWPTFVAKKDLLGMRISDVRRDLREQFAKK